MRARVIAAALTVAGLAALLIAGGAPGAGLR